MHVISGMCIEIMTGACCPPGSEAVVQKEHVRRRDGGVSLPEKIVRGQHIAPRGSECSDEDVVSALTAAAEVRHKDPEICKKRGRRSLCSESPWCAGWA